MVSPYHGARLALTIGTLGRALTFTTYSTSLHRVAWSQQCQPQIGATFQFKIIHSQIPNQNRFSLSEPITNVSSQS